MVVTHDIQKETKARVEGNMELGLNLFVKKICLVMWRLPALLVIKWRHLGGEGQFGGSLNEQTSNREPTLFKMSFHYFIFEL